MDLAFTPAQEAFRAEVRAFLSQNLPEDIRSTVDRGGKMTKEQTRRWHRIVYERGWAAPSWPVEHGGTGWDATEKHIFEEEMGLAGAPTLMPFGLKMVGPVIIAFGSEAQKTAHLPGILAGDVFWCQGYSEPNAGSDLASLRTKAVRQGDHYVINGQKTWTSYAHWADWIFCLVRTDDSGKPQAGISFILIDMKTPGITVRPIITIDGGHSVNETFFEDVRVPAANLIGEENKGWTYAKYLLGHERSSLARVGMNKRLLAKVTDAARSRSADGRNLIDDPAFRRKLARASVALRALELTNFRLLAEESAGRDIGPAASILKIKGTELTQLLTELSVEAAGYAGLPYLHHGLYPGSNEEPWGSDQEVSAMPDYLFNRVGTIYGGSNEIQRNVLAKAVLGL